MAQSGGDRLGLILEARIGAFPGWMVEIDYRFLVSEAASLENHETMKQNKT